MIVVVGEPLPPVTVVGLKLQEDPLGNPEQLNDTVPVNPSSGTIVTELVTLWPATTLTGFNGVGVMEKLEDRRAHV